MTVSPQEISGLATPVEQVIAASSWLRRLVTVGVELGIPPRAMAVALEAVAGEYARRVHETDNSS